MSEKISVIVITLNEENNIARCLESVRWADEIIVVDSKSQDGTEREVRKFTNNFFTKNFEDYASQKNYALSLATGDWILSVDADEQVTTDLKIEILAAIASPSFDAYRVPRRSRIFGRWMSATGTQRDKPVRLFRKNQARFEQPIHEQVSLRGPVGALTQAMNHYTYESLGEYWQRFNRYTTLEAQWLLKRGTKVGKRDILLRPPLMFLKLYCWDRGFCDGMAGFIFSVLSSFYVCVKYCKVLEK